VDENPNNLFTKAIDEAQAEVDHLTRAQAEARAKLAALRQGVLATTQTAAISGADASITSSPPRTAAEKVRLFRERFRGREDVFPRRWQNARSGKSGYSPACANEWIRGVCGKPKTRCSQCSSQAFVPVDDSVVLAHLNGRHTIGVYPLLPDNTCWFVAADFDEISWRDDVLAFADTCRAMGLPVAIERSRSGNGAHAWFFFAEPVEACHARRMASLVLTETMSQRHELSMQSYDRLFPSQDTIPKGGAAIARLSRQAGSGERVIVATGRYVGEGFDDARLDTLFLTMPVSWKGTLIQYTGRLHRLHPAKREVRIYDYVDVLVPILARRFEKRLRGYRALGYVPGEAPLGFGEIDDDFVLGRDWAETDGYDEWP